MNDKKGLSLPRHVLNTSDVVHNENEQNHAMTGTSANAQSLIPIVNKHNNPVREVVQFNQNSPFAGPGWNLYTRQNNTNPLVHPLLTVPPFTRQHGLLHEIIGISSQPKNQNPNQNFNKIGHPYIVPSHFPNPSELGVVAENSIPPNSANVLPQVIPSIEYPAGHYSDITTMVNSNSNIIAPIVETAFVDYKVCSVCGKRINRDMLRHMRTHQPVARFMCKFPREKCNHRSGKFNRPYDHKKHLLNRHFQFDDPNIKKVNNLKGKLKHSGACACGLPFVAQDWLDNHILTHDETKKCILME